jgi:hypothetical protein
MARPRGEIRQAITTAAASLTAVGDAGTWKDLGRAACVGANAARQTVKDMVKAGELRQLDTVSVPGSRRPMARYALRSSWESGGGGTVSLDNVLRGWKRG